VSVLSSVHEIRRGPSRKSRERERELEREYHLAALAVLARGAEVPFPIARGTGTIPVVLFVRTLIVLGGVS
jgi:hypothetical protein